MFENLFKKKYKEVIRPVQVGDWIKITGTESWYNFPIGEIKQVSFRGDAKGKEHIRYVRQNDDGTCADSHGLMDGHYVVLENYKGE